MALLDSESFSLSATYSDYTNYGILTRSDATSDTGSVISSSGGPLGDNYFSPGNSAQITRFLKAQATAFIFGVRIRVTASDATTQFIYFLDQLGVEQCSIRITSLSMTISRQGTLLGTVGALTANTWYYYEFAVTINASTGSVVVRRDEVQIASFTGINTNGGTGTDVYRLGFQGNNRLNVTHIYFLDTTGPAPWNTYLGNVRVWGVFPAATVEAGFTPIALTADYITGGIASSLGFSANTVYTSPVTISSSGKLVGLKLSFNTAYTGHWKLGLYANSAINGPGTLLYSTVEQTNAAIGTNIISFSDGPTLASGNYHLAFIADAASALNTQFSGSGPLNSFSQSYSLGLPTLGSGSTGSQFGLVGWAAVTTSTNEQEVNSTSLLPQTRYNYATVAGTQDLFSSANIGSFSPIYGVQVRVFFTRDDAGYRYAAPILQSGTAVAQGTPGAVIMGGGYNSYIYSTDPNTGAQWTAAALAAANFGYRITT